MVVAKTDQPYFVVQLLERLRLPNLVNGLSKVCGLWKVCVLHFR